MTGQGIDRDGDEATPRSHGLEECLVGRPHSLELVVGDGDALLRARVAHDRHRKRRVGQPMGLDGGPLLVGFKEWHARSQPDGDGPFRMKQCHAAGPVSAAAVAPQGPGGSGQFLMTGHGSQIDKCLLESLCRAVAWIAPHLAVGLLRLLIRRHNQGARVLSRQCLPVQVVGTGEPGRAGAFAAPMLVHDNPAERFHILRNPRGVRHRKNEFSRFRRRLVADPVIRGLRGGPHIVRWLLSHPGRRVREGHRDHEREHGGGETESRHGCGVAAGCGSR